MDRNAVPGESDRRGGLRPSLGWAAALLGTVVLLPGCDGELEGGTLTTVPALSHAVPLDEALVAGANRLVDEDARTQVARLVQCALPVGEVLEVRDPAGDCYAFQGHLGLAPEWRTGGCGETCQQWVAACMGAVDGVVDTGEPAVDRVLEAAADRPQATWSHCGGDELLAQAVCGGRMSACAVDGECCSGTCVGAYADLGWSGTCWF